MGRTARVFEFIQQAAKLMGADVADVNPEAGQPSLEQIQRAALVAAQQLAQLPTRDLRKHKEMVSDPRGGARVKLHFRTTGSKITIYAISAPNAAGRFLNDPCDRFGI